MSKLSPLRQLIVAFFSLSVGALAACGDDGGSTDASVDGATADVGADSGADGGTDSATDSGGTDSATDGGGTDAGVDSGGNDSGGNDSGGNDSGGNDSGMDGGMPDVSEDRDLCLGVDCSGMDGACLLGVCNPADGTCGVVDREEGAVCNTDECTTGQTCNAGVCEMGTAVDCSAMDGLCMVGVCNPADGSCRAADALDGSVCDAGTCFTAATCTAGICTGTATDCSAMDSACQVGQCNPADGSCRAMDLPAMTSCDTIACTTSQSCTAGTCGGGAAVLALNPLDDGSGASGAVGLPSLVMSEINPGDYIELFNTTGSDIALRTSRFQLCSPFSYVGLAVLAPTVTVPAGGYAVIPWPAAFTDVDTGGEVILYSSAAFGSDTAILDFVCWGINPHGTRKSQAENVNKWSGPCDAAVTSGAIHRNPSTMGTAASHYDSSAGPSAAEQCVP